MSESTLVFPFDNIQNIHLTIQGAWGPPLRSTITFPAISIMEAYLRLKLQNLLSMYQARLTSKKTLLIKTSSGCQNKLQQILLLGTSWFSLNGGKAQCGAVVSTI